MKNERKSNIVLITTDQQRWDALGVNGNSFIKTPNLDKLARTGVNFSRAYVQNTVCVPSRACIQTGRYTHQHGVTYMESVVDSTPGLPECELTFMEYLQEAEYYTGAAGKIHMYPEKGFNWMNLTGGKGARWIRSKGMDIGPAPLGENYEKWLEAKHPGAYENIYVERRNQENYKKIALMDIPLKGDEYVDYWIGEESCHFIDSHLNRDKPFFLWSGFCGPHNPLDPPEPYKSMYDPKDIELPDELPGLASLMETYQIDEALYRKVIAYYYGMISLIDKQVGEILDTLEKNKILDDTLIIFTSDHGEMLGDRGRMNKGVFYDGALRVPLIVKPPKNTKYQIKSTSKITEVFDVAPTILDYAGKTIPDNMSASSLRNFIENDVHETDVVLSEFVSNDKKVIDRCIVTERYKYIRHFSTKKEELYDLINDPDEINNLADSNGSLINEMRVLMLDATTHNS